MATPATAIRFPHIQLGQPIQLPPPARSQLVQSLKKQHPLHGEFAEVYETLGAQAHLKEWADENPTDFYRMFTAMAPKPQQVKHSGEIKISLSLQRNPFLDDENNTEIEDAEFEEMP